MDLTVTEIKEEPVEEDAPAFNVEPSHHASCAMVFKCEELGPETCTSEICCTVPKTEDGYTHIKIEPTPDPQFELSREVKIEDSRAELKLEANPETQLGCIGQITSVVSQNTSEDKIDKPSRLRSRKRVTSDRESGPVDSSTNVFKQLRTRKHKPPYKEYNNDHDETDSDYEPEKLDCSSEELDCSSSAEDSEYDSEDPYFEKTSLRHSARIVDHRNRKTIIANETTIFAPTYVKLGRKFEAKSINQLNSAIVLLKRLPASQLASLTLPPSSSSSRRTSTVPSSSTPNSVRLNPVLCPVLSTRKPLTTFIFSSPPPAGVSDELHHGSRKKLDKCHHTSRSRWKVAPRPPGKQALNRLSFGEVIETGRENVSPTAACSRLRTKRKFLATATCEDDEETDSALEHDESIHMSESEEADHEPGTQAVKRARMASNWSHIQKSIPSRERSRSSIAKLTADGQQSAKILQHEKDSVGRPTKCSSQSIRIDLTRQGLKEGFVQNAITGTRALSTHSLLKKQLHSYTNRAPITQDTRKLTSSHTYTVLRGLLNKNHTHRSKGDPAGGPISSSKERSEKKDDSDCEIVDSEVTERMSLSDKLALAQTALLRDQITNASLRAQSTVNISSPVDVPYTNHGSSPTKYEGRPKENSIRVPDPVVALLRAGWAPVSTSAIRNSVSRICVDALPDVEANGTEVVISQGDRAEESGSSTMPPSISSRKPKSQESVGVISSTSDMNSIVSSGRTPENQMPTGDSGQVTTEASQTDKSSVSQLIPDWDALDCRLSESGDHNADAKQSMLRTDGSQLIMQLTPIFSIYPGLDTPMVPSTNNEQIVTPRVLTPDENPRRSAALAPKLQVKHVPQFSPQGSQVRRGTIHAPSSTLMVELLKAKDNQTSKAITDAAINSESIASNRLRTRKHVPSYKECAAENDSDCKVVESEYDPASDYQSSDDCSVKSDSTGISSLQSCQRKLVSQLPRKSPHPPSPAAPTASPRPCANNTGDSGPQRWIWCKECKKGWKFTTLPEKQSFRRHLRYHATQWHMKGGDSHRRSFFCSECENVWFRDLAERVEHYETEHPGMTSQHSPYLLSSFVEALKQELCHNQRQATLFMKRTMPIECRNPTDRPRKRRRRAREYGENDNTSKAEKFFGFQCPICSRKAVHTALHMKSHMHFLEAVETNAWHVCTYCLLPYKNLDTAVQHWLVTHHLRQAIDNGQSITFENVTANDSTRENNEIRELSSAAHAMETAQGNGCTTENNGGSKKSALDFGKEIHEETRMQGRDKEKDVSSNVERGESSGLAVERDSYLISEDHRGQETSAEGDCDGRESSTHEGNGEASIDKTTREETNSNDVRNICDGEIKKKGNSSAIPKNSAKGDDSAEENCEGSAVDTGNTDGREGSTEEISEGGEVSLMEAVAIALKYLKEGKIYEGNESSVVENCEGRNDLALENSKAIEHSGGETLVGTCDTREGSAGDSNEKKGDLSLDPTEERRTFVEYNEGSDSSAMGDTERRDTLVMDIVEGRETIGIEAIDISEREASEKEDNFHMVTSEASETFSEASEGNSPIKVSEDINPLIVMRKTRRDSYAIENKEGTHDERCCELKRSELSVPSVVDASEPAESYPVTSSGSTVNCKIEMHEPCVNSVMTSPERIVNSARDSSEKRVNSKAESNDQIENYVVEKSEPRDTFVVGSSEPRVHCEEGSSEHRLTSEHNVDSVVEGSEPEITFVVESSEPKESHDHTLKKVFKNEFQTMISNWKYVLSFFDRPYPCQACGKCFIQKAELKEHMKLQGECKQQAVPTCSICSKTFDTYDDVQTHKKCHKAYPITKCEVCNMRVKATRIRSHMREAHNNQQPGVFVFVCEICGKGFNRRALFKGHMNKHTGTLLKCSYCEATFTHAFSKYRHERNHRGVDKVKCPICPAEFVQKSSMNRHMKIHLKLRYKCDICGKGYSQTHPLMQHRQKKHPGAHYIPASALLVEEKMAENIRTRKQKKPAHKTEEKRQDSAD